MLSEDEESKFVDDLCQKLENEKLGDFDDERSLNNYLCKVINDWKNTTPYRGKVQAWNDSFMIEKVSAFNGEKGPDICIRTKEKPSFIAIELKLCKEDRKGWALKTGIGQSIICSSMYDYTILFCLSKVGSVKEKHEHDARIKSALWACHKIRVIMRYPPEDIGTPLEPTEA